MGLDNFRTDKDDSNDSDESHQDGEQAASEDEPSGLDAFRTDTTRGGSTSSSDSDEEDDETYGLPTHEKKQMSKDEWIRYVRDNHISDYYSSYQPDERWDYERCVEISCVCGNSFTFLTTGICLECGRVYMDAGRTVIKKSDPHEDNEIDNESIQDN